MESYSATRTYGSTHYGFPQDPVTERAPYKVNKVALGILLVLGIVPGLAYLAVIGILNCLGGREVTRQQEDFFSVDHQSFQHYPQVERRQPTSRTPLVGHEDSRGSSYSQKQSKRQQRDVGTPSQTHGVKRGAKKDRSRTHHQSKRREESPSVVDRVVTRPTNQSAIPSQHQVRQSKHSSRSSATHAVDPTVPAPIREKREPRNREEEVAVNIYMGTQVINLSKLNDESERPERIAKMKVMARQLRYDKKAEPGSFQGFLAHMYNNSYKTLYG